MSPKNNDFALIWGYITLISGRDTDYVHFCSCLFFFNLFPHTPIIFYPFDYAFRWNSKDLSQLERKLGHHEMT